MEHREAVQSQNTEKYLLGELRGQERDDFEAHFFECEACAEAVRTGVLFMDNAAAELPEMASRPVAARATSKVSPKTSWRDWFHFDWRQPAFAMPLLGLIAVSGLWVADHAHLSGELASATEPQTFAEVQLDHTRGATDVAVSRQGRYFAVSFYINDDSLPEYAIEISGNGVAPATVPLTHQYGSYHLLLPFSRYKPGSYEITVKAGKGTDGRIFQRFPLSL